MIINKTKFLISRLLPKNLDKKYLIKVSSFLGFKILGIVVSYLFIWWFTQNYGAAKWGFIAVCMNMITLLGFVGLLGYDVLAMKIVIENKKDGRSIKDFYFKSLLIIGLFSFFLCGLIWLFLNPLSLFFFSSTINVPWIKVVALGIPVYVVYQFNIAVLGGSQEYLWYGLFKNVFTFTGTFLLGLVLHYYLLPNYLFDFRHSGILFLVGYILIFGIGSAISFLLIVCKQQFLRVQRVSNFSLKSLMFRANPFYIYSLMSLIIIHGDILMLSLMTNETEVGYYDIGIKISLLTYFLAVGFNSILPIRISDLYTQNKMTDLRKICLNSSKLLFWLSLPIMLFIIIFREELLMLFGEEFRRVSTALIILTLAQFINTISIAASNLLKMTDGHLILRNIMLITAIINIGLNYCLIPKYGMEGAALATFIATFIWNTSCIYFVKIRYGMNTLYIPILTELFYPTK